MVGGETGPKHKISGPGNQIELKDAKILWITKGNCWLVASCLQCSENVMELQTFDPYKNIDDCCFKAETDNFSTSFPPESPRGTTVGAAVAKTTTC